ncbi:MAG TPA: septation protein A [Methylobacterium sp.]|jgi:intracellular septation protein
MQIEAVPPRRHLAPVPKLVLELGPLVLFFLGNAYAERFGVPAEQKLFLATGVFVVATMIALGVHYALMRRLPIMPMVSGVVVVVFGGLTLFLQDKTFIMMKPTIVNTLFGLVLLGGLAFGKPLLSVVLDSMFALTDEGWRKLTLRWALFFLLLAVLNEVVWRTQTEDFWVNFKVFGIMPLTVVFALSQTPLLMRYERKEPAAP